MNTTLLRSSLSAGDPSLPDFAMSEAELAILRMPSLSCWLEVDHGVEASGGWRWQMRGRLARGVGLRANDPLSVAGSDGKPALRLGYGSAEFTGADRGAIRLPSLPPLLAPAGWTVYSVIRVPTVASGESATVGGHVWACQGPTGNNTPRLNVSGSTGKTILYGGGKTFSNPPGDLRDGLWHVVACRLDTASGQINAYTDRARYVGAATGATTLTPDASLVPDIGVYRSASAAPFYGDLRAFLTFSAPHSLAERLAVETYLAAKWGATLVDG